MAKLFFQAEKLPVETVEGPIPDMPEETLYTKAELLVGAGDENQYRLTVRLRCQIGRAHV